jgi:GNAT superfamily N-acetyltransferase
MASLSASLISELKEIFFESSSKKDFQDEREKQAFYWKYLGLYLSHFPQLLWIERREKVLGYCVGCSSTLVPEVMQSQPHLKVFEDLFNDYPAHFHVNCHAEARGKGIGAQLILRLEEKLKEELIPGVHLITSPSSRNRSFYLRLGYNQEVVRPWQGQDLLFMGKKLTLTGELGKT